MAGCIGPIPAGGCACAVHDIIILGSPIICDIIGWFICQPASRIKFIIRHIIRIFSVQKVQGPWAHIRLTIKMIAHVLSHKLKYQIAEPWESNWPIIWFWFDMLLVPSLLLLESRSKSMSETKRKYDPFLKKNTLHQTWSTCTCTRRIIKISVRQKLAWNSWNYWRRFGEHFSRLTARKWFPVVFQWATWERNVKLWMLSELICDIWWHGAGSLKVAHAKWRCAIGARKILARFIPENS